MNQIVGSRTVYSPRFSLRLARRLIFQRRLIFCFVVSFMILAFVSEVISGQPPPLRSRAVYDSRSSPGRKVERKTGYWGRSVGQKT